MDYVNTSGRTPQSTREEIIAAAGPGLDGMDVMSNQILVGIYIRPEKTKGGILLTDATRDEDKWQGKIGIVLKKGPLAFQNDDRNDFAGQNVEVGDWVLYRVSDGFSLDVKNAHCRLLEDVHIKGRVTDPSVIY